MRVCPAVPLSLAVAALAACSNSSSGAPVVGAAVVGPEGGTVAVASGAQAGLLLTIPPGALTKTLEIRIRDLTAPPPVDTGTAVAPTPNEPFLIEPDGLRLEQRATLRAPYVTTRVVGTAPGNVRVRETRAGNAIDYEPEVVDLANGHAETPIRYLGRYQVVQGARAEQGLASYLPAAGSAVALDGGFTLAAEVVPSTSPFAAENAVRWRLTRPLVFGAPPQDLVYFHGAAIVGRESTSENWRETWSTPYTPWSQIDGQSSGPGSTMPTSVQAPLGSLGIGGQITVFGLWSWAPPVRIGARLLLDVVQLHVSLAWNRLDLGVGQRDYRFLFAPGIGFLGVVEDGVQHLRTSL